MTELEKIEYAKSFLDKLANGINPLDDSPIPDGDVACNVRLSRCFFYVSDILRQVIENGGVQAVKKVKKHKKVFSLTDEERGSIQASEAPLSVREISKRLNDLIDLKTMKKISATTINHWLMELRLLEAVVHPDGKRGKLPTEEGRAIGIFTEKRTGPYGDYIIVLFSQDAQQFIYDHLEAITGSRDRNVDSRVGSYGRRWTEEQDECLIDLFKKNVPLSEIASTLKRTEGGIRARLKNHGLIEI